MPVIDKGHDRFAAGVAAWRAGFGKVRDAVRQELVARQLAAYLPPVTAAAPGVLDVGCGQGTQAIVLARCGYEVTGVDVSEELFDTGRAAASAEPGEVRRGSGLSAVRASRPARRRCPLRGPIRGGVLPRRAHVPAVAGRRRRGGVRCRWLVSTPASTTAAAEEQAGRRDPYRQVCALSHTLARRSEGSMPDREDRRRG